MQSSKHLTNDEKLILGYIATRTLSHYQNLLKPIFEMYRIEGYFKYFIENDTSGYENAFHDRNHSFSVALNCYEGAVYEKITRAQTRILLIAALFHDFNHSQGNIGYNRSAFKVLDDKYNIDTAITGFQKAHDSISQKHQLTASDVLSVKNTIKTTLKPLTTAKVRNHLFDIIRDADNMMTYELSSVRLQSYSGLYLEEIKSIDVTPLRFFTDLHLSLTKVIWKTKWGRDKYTINNYPKMVRDLIQDLKDQYKINV